jgi:thiol-disulfide isomerase/thioredoxin
MEFLTMRRAIVFGLAFCLAATFYRSFIHTPSSLLQPDAVEAADAPKDAEVTLQILDWEGVQKLLASKKGQVVVLDAWSTSCVPCVREFPNLVALQKKLGKEVACVSLSCDYAGIKSKPPEFYREKVLKFLTKQNAKFDNVLSSLPAEETYEKLGIPSIPAVFVYGRDGKLVKKFDNSEIQSDDEEFTYADVTKVVEAEVKK